MSSRIVTSPRALRIRLPGYCEYHSNCDDGRMGAQDLKAARLARGWSQTEAARRLGVSQSYLAMLERGQRRLPPNLTRRAARVYRLPPTVLPLPEPSPARSVAASQTLARDLAALGYPGFAYLRSRGARPVNPAALFIRALAQDDLEPRVLEALPWLLLRYWDLDEAWLMQAAKLCDLQNRLGFVVGLARRLAERAPHEGPRLEALRGLEAALDQSRLAREDTLCRASMRARERARVREQRSGEAKHWNLLTDWRPDMLAYAA